VPQFIQSCNVKTMSKTRLNIRRQLILFERLESDKRLAVLYQALLEHKYAEQLELEEAESRDLTEEERRKTKEEFCLYDKEENDLVAKLYSLCGSLWRSSSISSTEY
jgi:hypothetical protein